jgi:hypothetical protein
MNEQVLRHDKHCRLCGSLRITPVLKLKDTPLEDQFVSDKSIKHPVYPLELALCEDCSYVHLPHVVSPEASYADYVYVSGVTVGLRNHYDQYAQQIVESFSVPEKSLVVDLGSNDGSMLASFKRIDMEVVGVEPAGNIAASANKSGLTTINDFFSDEVASHILENYGPAHIITANYMYANIDDVVSFTKSVAKLMAPDGIFVVQTGYHPEQMKIKMFDYIYHEHFSYFTVEVLKNLFSICGMEVIDAQKMTPKGGSIRIVGQLKNGNRKVNPCISKLIEEEHQQGIKESNTYRKFSQDIDESKKELLKLLKKLKKEGKKIAGFGASHSTTTLIYHFELAPYIDFLVDDNSLKHDHFSPGYHLPVYSPEKLRTAAPDYIIILGWQHKNSIMQKHKLTHKEQWIIPLPQLQII